MGNTSTDGVLLPFKLESASLGFEFGFLKKKAHIEVDSFGFDFVFRSWEPFDRNRLFSSLGLLFCFRFHTAEADFFSPASGILTYLGVE